MTISRGSTFTIIYDFKMADPEEIVAAYMTIKQLDRAVVERDLTTAGIYDGKLYWTLTQEESLKLSDKAEAVIYLDYTLSNGIRCAGKTEHADIIPPGKNEVI